jgi:hypothetical protein
MSDSTYLVLSFNLNSRSGYCTHQAFQRFDELSGAMTYGASELTIRDGVIILRSETAASVEGKEGLQPVAVCGVAEARAVALYVTADFKRGHWPPAERQSGGELTHERLALRA